MNRELYLEEWTGTTCVKCGEPIEEGELRCAKCEELRRMARGVLDKLMEASPMIHEANLAPAAGEGLAGHMISRPICGKRSGRKGKPVRIRQRRIP